MRGQLARPVTAHMSLACCPAPFDPCGSPKRAGGVMQRPGGDGVLKGVGWWAQHRRCRQRMGARPAVCAALQEPGIGRASDRHRPHIGEVDEGSSRARVAEPPQVALLCGPAIARLRRLCGACAPRAPSGRRCRVSQRMRWHWTCCGEVRGGGVCHMLVVAFSVNGPCPRACPALALQLPANSQLVPLGPKRR